MKTILMQKNRNKQGVPPARFLRQLMALMLIMLTASTGAWAADYVLTYTYGGTTYYLARSGTDGVTRVNTFNPTTCIWSCETAAGDVGTLNNNTTYGWLYQTVNGTKYYLKHGGTLGLSNTKATTTGNNARNVQWFRTNGTYVYNAYQTARNTFTTYYINLANNTPGSNTNANTAGNARPYQVTTNSVAVNNNGITAPTISCSGLSGSAGIQLSRTGVGGSYIPAHTTYAFNNQTIYYYNNTVYTNTNQFAVSVNANDATYNWSVTAGTANVSTTGVVTLGNNNTQNVTVRCRATINGVNKDATYTLTATATAALNETVYGEMTITPASTTLDLGGTSTYTASASISKLTRTRPQYVAITDQQSHTHYKVGTTYQATEPTITETPGSANFTQIGWSFSGGAGNYYNPSTYSSQSTNELVLTRTATVTGTQQTFTITATGRYDGWEGPEKTANATVTIPLTQVDITNLYPGEALSLGMGGVGSVVGHYSWQPNDPSAGQTYTNFKYTSNSTSIATVDASGNVTAVSPGSTTITVTAVKLDGTDGVTCNVTVNVAIDAPTISIDGSGNVTITHPVPGVQIRYTTNGVDPTATTGTVYSGTFAASNEQTIKAIAVANGVASAVASQFYATSGVSDDGKVILNDYEDHTWTYYAGVPTEVDGGHYNNSYKASGTGTRRNVRLYSPNPRNLKITYNGVNGITGSSINVKVSTRSGEDQNTFVYYITLEEGATAGQYPYQVISNPFSVRPSTGTGNGKVYYGFNGWKIVSGGEYINGYSNGQTIPIDAEITFVNLPYPSVNCTSAEIVFETTWTQATVQRGGGNVSNAAFNGGNYEKNFCVINANYTNALAPTYPVTITSVEPDGSATYNVTFSNLVTPASGATNMTKLEYMNWNPSNTINPQGRNLTIGRGVTMGGTTRALVGTGTAAAMNQVLKVESGTFTTFTSYTATPTSRTKHWVIFGCDYDRAKADNSKLTFSGKFLTATGRNLGYNSTGEMARVWSKSGSFMTGISVSDAAADNSYYIGVTTTQNQGHRYLEIQGGEWYASIAGGMGDNHTATEPGFTFRMKGGKIRGSVYGAAAWSGAGGTRTYIITGGEINGWVAAGANGTQSDGGKNDGASYVYVGGNAVIDSKHSTTAINRSVGGNVYGAGCGYSATSSSGEMTLGSNMVVADNAYIERGIYGGGGFGFVTNTQTSYIYVTGGHVGGYTGNDYGGTRIQGGVYGGARQNKGGSAIIYMTGGLVETGIYGGSNNSGTMNGSVTMQINGGQVGTSTTPGNIHGGGYGQNTIVSRNVDITLGKTGAARDADGVTVWGDVYGGSALGKVNGEAATNTYHTNVTMYAGYIHGSLYGGALGSGTVAANVYGPVQVKVYGGSVFNTDGTGANGSGAVYGANNINGAPQRSVTVDIYGTNSAPAEGEYALFSVYGGGNAADYTYGNGYPKVTVHNCDNSIKYVYGGGNAAAVAATDVTIYGGNKIGNVFGGGNGQVRAADVNGNTNVKIYGGTIGDVYGGSNTKGDIGGTISVNVNAQAEPSKTACPINIDNVYGGGNKAPSAAGNVTIGCAEHIGAVYGGANQANITGDINLNIVSGHIDNVFGGNNTSGNISGTITVTVNDTNFACGMEVGNVYGGGNKAAYGTGTNYPVVNIKNGHLTGSVFGGGLGATAVVTGSPRVTIGQPSADTVHIDGNVFGGGDAAEVVGKPTVLVQNCNTMIGTKNGAGEWNTTGGTVYGGGNAADITGGTTVTITGGSINRVFGGGNGEVSPANVTGNASTLIHGGLIHQAFAGSNTQGSIGGTASITVDHDNTACGELIDELYGGGNLAAGNAGSVTIECGAIVGDVYGGANQAAVNSDITLNITGGTIARAFGGNNTSGAISGAITVNVNKDPSCDLSLGSVFGAGNQAPYTGNPVVNIKNGTVTNNVYGGGLGASAVVTGNPQVTIGDSSNPAWVATVGGDVYGGGDAAAVVGTPVVHVIAKTNTIIANVYGGGNAADVSGTNVTIDGGQITGMVFGGGHGDKNSEPQKEANVTGDVTLNVTGGTINKVFAGSNSKGNITGNVNFTINKGNTSNPMHINEVYGGGNEAAGNAGTINIICTGGADEGIGDVYGGANAADINSDITLNITGGKIANVFGGNNTSGDINGGIAVNVDWNGGCAQNSLGNVYGGGNLAQYTIPDGKALAVNIKNGTVTNNVYGGGKGAANDHTKGQVTGSPVVTVGVADNDKQAIVNGDVYGGGDAGNVVGTPVVNVINKCNTQIANVYGGGNAADVNGTDVNIDGGNITGMVFGGGHGDRTSEPQKEANVAGDVHVDVTGGTINKVFGGSNSKGNIAGQIALNINKGNSSCDMHIAEVYGGGNEAAGNAGTITIGCTGGEDEGIGDVYGGANAAAINSDITLNITGGKIANVFGGNNTSGAIDGGISVTVDWSGSCGTNSLGSVFGAGNQAPYTGSPVVYIKNGTINNNVFGGGLGATAVVTGDPQVTIGNATAANSDYVHIIGNVFGGGDAANVEGSPSVTVNNCNTLVGTKDGEGAWIATNGTVYGGGNAAHVTGDGHNTNVTINGGDIYRVFGGGNGEVSPANVAGDANTTIHGGNIHQAFAGSNTQGAISGTARISIDHTSTCPEKIDELYGGGNLAAGGAGEVNIGCNAVLDDVYGGANQADVSGDITLNITGGTIGRAFGGNNKSGVIDGAIEVNVIHDGSCALSLGYVYGAGNQAPYTTPDGKVGPTVNIKNGTVDNNVFGGGLGASARVTGNPVVTIGDNTNPAYNAVVLGEVYGGGDAAPTFGNPTVNMGKGNVKTIYGGGKGADAVVTGNPTVNVSGTADIDFYVFGGGDAARTAGSPTVNITGGVVGNRIGGLSTPSPAGSIYGGGKGSSANVDGNPVVNISNVADVKYNVFGGGSEAPTNGNTSVIMTSGMVQKNIFGGGEGATATTRNTTVKVSGASTKVGENVYGGGLGAEVNGETNVLIGADE